MRRSIQKYDTDLTRCRSTIGADRPATSQSDTTSQAVLDRRLVSEFRRRADAYMALHEKLQKRGTRPKERGDIGENLVSENALALRIGFARHDARPGDLFTLPIAVALRRAMDPELRGLAQLSTRESIRDDAPEVFVLAVNAVCPAGAPRSAMPGNALKVLPQLPRGLEYRIVDTHLVCGVMPPAMLLWFWHEDRPLLTGSLSRREKRL